MIHCVNDTIIITSTVDLTYSVICSYLTYLTSSAGKAGELIDRGDNTYGGKFVVNPSGGLISKGHPLGATGTLNLSPTLFLTKILINLFTVKYRLTGVLL